MAERKKKTVKRKRSDSAASELAAIQSVDKTIDPPSEISINDNEMRFWKLIIGSRAYDAWTPNDLMLAGMLSRCYSDIEKYSKMLSQTRLIKDGNGNPKISPAHKIVDDLHKQALSLSRTLQIHPRATQGEARDQVKRNELYGQAKSKMDDMDELIARPVH
jgi:phage terminase small subunit